MASIAIIGTGSMARGLAEGWAKAGHEIVLGSRDPAARSHLTEEIGNGVKVASVEEALDSPDLVVLAIPYRAVEGFASAHAARLLPLSVIDISNPFDNLPDNREAGAEITARAIGQGARIVAAFKDNFATTLLDPVDPGGLPRDVHYAGDDEEAKSLLSDLIRDLGFRPVDCGPLRNARILGGMVPLMVELDRRYGSGGTSSWKFLAPESGE